MTDDTNPSEEPSVAPSSPNANPQSSELADGAAPRHDGVEEVPNPEVQPDEDDSAQLEITGPLIDQPRIVLNVPASKLNDEEVEHIAEIVASTWTGPVPPPAIYTAFPEDVQKVLLARAHVVIDDMEMRKNSVDANISAERDALKARISAERDALDARIAADREALAASIKMQRDALDANITADREEREKRLALADSNNRRADVVLYFSIAGWILCLAFAIVFFILHNVIAGLAIFGAPVLLFFTNLVRKAMTEDSPRKTRRGKNEPPS